MNIPKEHVLPHVEAELSQINLHIKKLTEDEKRIVPPPLSKEAISRGKTKSEFTLEQSTRIRQIVSQIYQLNLDMKKIKAKQKRITEGTHPLCGAKVLRIKICHETEHELNPEFKNLITQTRDAEDGKYAGTDLVSELENNQPNQARAQGLFIDTADSNKYGRIFAFNHLQNCLLHCPLTGAIHKADITEYSSYGDLEFVFEKYLHHKDHERNKDVLGWVIARMLNTLKILHHRFDTVHGDVKPANFLVNKDFSLRLVDYDFTKPAGTKAKIGGTHGYQYPFHPEKMELHPQTGARMAEYIYEFDVYAVGVSIFKLILGSHEGTLLNSSGNFDNFGAHNSLPSKTPVMYFHEALGLYTGFFGTKLRTSPFLKKEKDFRLFLRDLLIYLTMLKSYHPFYPKDTVKFYKEPVKSLVALYNEGQDSIPHVDLKSCKERIEKDNEQINLLKEDLKPLFEQYIDSKKPPAEELFKMLYADRIGDYLGCQIYEFLVRQLQVHLDDLAESFRLAQTLFGSKFEHLAPPNSKLELTTASKMFDSVNLSSSGSKEGNIVKSVFSSVFGEMLELAELLLNRIGGLSRLDREYCDGKSHWFPCFSENSFSLDVECSIRNPTNGQMEKQLKIPKKEIGFGQFLLSKRGESPLELSKLIGFPQLINLKHPQQIPLVVNTKLAPAKLEWDWLHPSQILSRLERIHRSSTAALQDAKIHAQSNSESLENTKCCLPLLEKLLPKTAATKLKSRVSGLITADDIPDLEICFLQTFKNLSQVFTHLRPQGDNLEMDVALDKKGMVEYLEAHLTAETKTTCSVQSVVDKLEQNLKQTETLKVCKRIDAVKPGIHEGFFKHVKVDMKFNWGTSNPHVAKLQKLVRNLERGLQGITSKKNHTPK